METHLSSPERLEAAADPSLYVVRSCMNSRVFVGFAHRFISIWTTFLRFCCVPRKREVLTFSVRPENTATAAILSLDQQVGIRGREESAFLWLARVRDSQINSSVISFIIHTIAAILFGIRMSRGGVCRDGMFRIQIIIQPSLESYLLGHPLVPANTLPFWSGLQTRTVPASPWAAKCHCSETWKRDERGRRDLEE